MLIAVSIATLMGLATCATDMAKTTVWLRLLFGEDEQHGSMPLREACDTLAHDVGMFAWPMLDRFGMTEDEIISELKVGREGRAEELLDRGFDFDKSKFSELTDVYVYVGRSFASSYNQGRSSKQAVERAGAVCVIHLTDLAEEG